MAFDQSLVYGLRELPKYNMSDTPNPAPAAAPEDPEKVALRKAAKAEKEAAKAAKIAKAQAKAEKEKAAKAAKDAKGQNNAEKSEGASSSAPAVRNRFVCHERTAEHSYSSDSYLFVLFYRYTCSITNRNALFAHFSRLPRRKRKFVLRRNS